MFVESPPMSQRSHIAHSGRSAIIECSAACSVPSSFGISSSPVELRGLGQVPDRLGLEARLRQVERRPSRASTGRESTSSGTRPPARSRRCARRRGRGRSGARCGASPRSPCSSPSSPACSSRPCSGVTTRRARLQIELADEVALAEVQVDGAFVHGRVRTLALDEARAPSRSAPRRPRTGRASSSGGRTAPAG